MDRGFRHYGKPQGLPTNSIKALEADKDGNFWLGSDGGGALKLARDGFTSFPQRRRAYSA
jgi:ligand-binding sensor domain-containing protein